MAQHADKLTEGTKALLQKYPTFRVDVYPTHRTVAFPKFVADNTAKNATKAKTTNEGRSHRGRARRLPVPDSEERQRGDVEPPGALQRPAYEAKYRNLNVDSSGRASLATEGISVQDFPFWDTSQDRRRHLLAHQAHLHRPGSPRR